MRRFSLLIFLIVMDHYDSSAQWTVINSGIEGNYLSVYFLNQDTGFVVGQDGVIIKTKDGGDTWTKKNSGTEQHLSQVTFINDSIGFAVGNHGTITKTIDGGENWISSDTLTTNSLYSICFTTQTNGVIVGDNAAIFMTKDQGMTWNKLPAIAVLGDTVYSLNSVKFVNDSIGYTAGGNWFINSNAIILKTYDGGNNWEIIYTNDSYNPISICSLFPINDHRLWAIGYVFPQTYGPSLMYSNDAGTSFTLFDCPPFCYEPNSWVDGIFFTDELHGYMASGGGILSTYDGGISWQQYTLDIWRYLDAVYFVNKEVGYAVGDDNTIIKTSNGGGILGIDDINKNSALIQLFPNPASDFVTLQLPPSLISNFNISITDVLGKTVFEKNSLSTNSASTIIPLDQNFSQGIYFVQVSSGEKYWNSRIIIQR